jgi:hypothetical protein
MMFTCAPLCANPAHGHARLRRTRKSAATKVVKNRRGKLVDLLPLPQPRRRGQVASIRRSTGRACSSRTS